MLFEFSPLLYPADQDSLFFCRQRQIGFGRGHPGQRIIGKDAVHHFASVGIAGNDGTIALTVGQSRTHPFFGIEPQVCYPAFGVWAMTRKTAIGQDGTNMQTEADALGNDRV